MKKITNTILIATTLILFSGCSAWKNNWNKTFKALGEGDFKVTVWSGGLPAAEYYVKNSFVNTEQNTDGYFFFVDGKLVRVSGTITIEQL